MNESTKRWLSQELAAGTWLACVVLGLVSPILFAGQSTKAPPTTRPRNYARGKMLPTARYAGAAQCAQCHTVEASTHRTTPMALAAESAAESSILREHPRLTFRLGPYSYQIVRDGTRSIYSVTEGKITTSVPIKWAFGRGEAGQTYVFQRDGSYYQSRVSFYNDTQQLDLTLGFARTVPHSLEEALGDRLSTAEARLCFGCHSTAAVSKGQLNVQTMVPGVSCEACHGPGARHVAAMKAGRLRRTYIQNPGKQAAEDLIDFCGSCHRTWLMVQSMQVRGVNNVRFQPYRLENSRCWNGADARLSCLACHDPHRPRQRNAAFYDSKCLSCHGKRGTTIASKPDAIRCPVSTQDCVTCHMPKYELPGGHFKFTDHQIRVVRAGEQYPN
jgi:cytochrome c554/c'-like protein